jgi:ketosteroid isomerase-like protein
MTNGKRYQNTYLSLFVIRDGRVAMVREYCDTAVNRAAFS